MKAFEEILEGIDNNLLQIRAMIALMDEDLQQAKLTDQERIHIGRRKEVLEARTRELAL
jgi:hypothetical protein